MNMLHPNSLNVAPELPTTVLEAPLLQIRDLRVSFRTDKKNTVEAVKGISFDIARNTTVALVGESGSGKSVSSLAVMGLLSPDSASIGPSSSVLFEGRDLLTLSPTERRQLCGKDISMIFQEPMTSLNPAFTIGNQLIEAIRCHRDISHAAARVRAIEMLNKVRIPSPEQRIDTYPHKLSGGMRQRVMIAMALACEPKLLIADEPTTALDVTIQAQVLALMRSLRASAGTAIILITHDLGVIAELADEVAVMYAGRVVERSSVERLFAEPQHPYTIGLLGSIPKMHLTQSRLAVIEGQVPSPTSTSVGCRFAARCPFADAKCFELSPPLQELSADHFAACWKAPLAWERAA